MSYLCQKCQKNGVTVFVLEIKRAVNYTDFEKLSHIIEHGLQGFKVKSIEGESTETNDLRACSHGGGGPQVGEVPRLGGVTSLSIQSLFFS